MIDIAFGFKGQAYKRARTTMKLYALVIVCMLTGATNLLILEGLETQDVVGALERHASRHGFPSEIFVDNGSQLLTLKDVRFSLRDVDSIVYKSMGMRVHPSTAKSQEERGRVERKIRSVREMMEKLGIRTDSAMTSLQWETTLAKIASTLDDLPIAKGNSSNLTNLGYEILTCNRLKLGRNNFRSLEGDGMDFSTSKFPDKVLEKVREVYGYWFQMFIDNIHMLTLKPDKFRKSDEPPKIDDIVLFTMSESGYTKSGVVWKLGKVLKVETRQVLISYVSRVNKNKPSTMGKVLICFRDVSVLYSVDDLFINSPEHHHTICGDLFGNTDEV